MTPSPLRYTIYCTHADTGSMMEIRRHRFYLLARLDAWLFMRRHPTTGSTSIHRAPR